MDMLLSCRIARSTGFTVRTIMPIFPWGLTSFGKAGQYWSDDEKQSTKSYSPWMGFEWSTVSSAPRPLHQAIDSGRDAVAITLRRASFFASWIAIEPTPPAPPRISNVLPEWAP